MNILQLADARTKYHHSFHGLWSLSDSIFDGSVRACLYWLASSVAWWSVPTNIAQSIHRYLASQGAHFDAPPVRYHGCTKDTIIGHNHAKCSNSTLDSATSRHKHNVEIPVEVF